MENNILVSIVIPVYNTEKYLQECLDSVIKQTYSNLEIIIVDDGSKDNCENIINNYIKNDKRITYLKQKHKGVTSARKHGVAYAHGDYICSIDSDDYIEPNYIEILLRKAIETNADFVQCAFNCFGIKNKTYIFDQYTLNIEGKQTDVLKQWIDGTHSIGSQIYTKIFKASVIKEALLHSSLKINEGEDVMHFIHYLKLSNTISSIGNVLYHYRYRNDSISHKINLKWIMREMIMINKLTNLIKKEYNSLDSNALSQWNKRYKRNRINDYINFYKK